MSTPVGLLVAVCRAVAPVLTGGGSTTAEVGAKIVCSIWEWWGAKTKEAERRRELEDVARMTAAQCAAAVRDALASQAGAPPFLQSQLHAYVLALQAQVRRASRRPSDPAGLTVSAHMPLSRAEDLAPLLPPRLPRFAPGHPVAGTDLKLVALLGIGGFGEVWKARNPYLKSDPPVALKFCLDPEAAASLRREARLLDAIRREGKHPGVVNLHRTYLSADPPFLEYEWVDGGDLGGFVLDRVRQSGAVPPAEAVRIVRSLADVAAFAHAKGIVHRDLKPANVLSQRGRRADGKTEVRFKVTDFGIGGITAAAAARAVARPGTLTTGGSLGAYTAHYASPEQERGEPPDPRDDVHALGVIWYQMLVGDLNVSAPRGSGWKKRLAERGTPPAHVALIEACISSERADRPADGAVLVSELQPGGPDVTEVVEDGPPPQPAPEPTSAPRTPLAQKSKRKKAAREPAEAGALGDPAAWPRYRGLLAALRSVRSDRQRVARGKSWGRWALSTFLANIAFMLFAFAVTVNAKPEHKRYQTSSGSSGYNSSGSGTSGYGSPSYATYSPPTYKEYTDYGHTKGVAFVLVVCAASAAAADRGLWFRGRRGAIPPPAETGFLTFLAAACCLFAVLLSLAVAREWSTYDVSEVAPLFGVVGLHGLLLAARRVVATRVRERVRSTPVAAAKEYAGELAALAPGGFDFRDADLVGAAIATIEEAYEAGDEHSLADNWHRLFAPL